ncbi:MAG: alanyl-tRNA editing protein, partial [Acidobacteria bacterium]|nr:alanyl-tRNA editing protein [Acidobacteriota bacterium]
MTERLYYDDSYLYEFDALVLECTRAPEENRWQVTLNRTAFYPTSGGQPFDTGRLGPASVVDVTDLEEKGIVHLVDSAVEAGPVRGKVNWQRRFDHMQQHTGQHILSAAFVELFNFPTVSFHLGREICTIDLSQAPTAEQFVAAESRANEIVFSNRKVEVLYGTAQELQKLGIRKEVDREGVLRAISIRDFDRQPCGGTHVAQTGEVGLILLR